MRTLVLKSFVLQIRISQRKKRRTEEKNVGRSGKRQKIGQKSVITILLQSLWRAMAPFPPPPSFDTTVIDENVWIFLLISDRNRPHSVTKMTDCLLDEEKTISNL